MAKAERTRFALQWVALHRVWFPLDEKSFKLKPKVQFYTFAATDLVRDATGLTETKTTGELSLVEVVVAAVFSVCML